MTRRLTKAEERRRGEVEGALNIAADAALASWEKFADEVRAAFKAANRKLPDGRAKINSIDRAVDDMDRAGKHAIVTGDPAYVDCVQHLSRVIQAMVVIERIKLNRAPVDWLNRHFGQPEPAPERPRRRHAEIVE